MFSLLISIISFSDCRLTIKAKCPMELRNFPMDRQSCPLILGSCKYIKFEMRHGRQRALQDVSARTSIDRGTKVQFPA